MLLKKLFSRSGLSYTKLRCFYGIIRKRTSGAAVSVAETPPTSDFSPSSLRSRHKSDKLASPHNEYYYISIIDAFISLGMVEDAEPVFNFFRRQGHQFDTEVYNMMLSGWSEKGNALRARMLFENMVEDGVEYNTQTFAAMLEVYARCEDWKSAGEIVSQLEAQGYELKHILHQTRLSLDQTDQITKVLDHFGVVPKAPPPVKVEYPRLVRSFYETWSQDRKKILTMSSPALSQLYDKDTLHRNFERQLEIERKGYDEIESIIEQKPAYGSSGKELLSQLTQIWKIKLTEIIQKDIDDFLAIMELVPISQKVFRGPKQFPFIALLPAEVWSDILVDEVLIDALKQPDGLPLYYICNEVGRAAWKKYIILTQERRGGTDKVRLMYKNFVEKLLTPGYSNQPARVLWNEIDRDTMNHGSLGTTTPHWPRRVGAYTVSALVRRLLEVATFPSTDYRQTDEDDFKQLPAFEHVVEVVGDANSTHSKEPYEKTGFIRPHKNLYKMYKNYFHKDAEASFRMNCSFLPMLVPPRPWTSPESGGYLLTPSLIIRCSQDTYQHKLLLKQSKNLHAVFDSLNYVGSCPWTINHKILDLAIKVYNGGGDVQLDIPIIVPEDTQVEGEDSEPLSRYEKQQQRKLRNESFSLRMDMLYRLSLANHYRNDVFWLPHNMDFRGRAYPIPPHVTHITMDVGRALLKMAVGYPLGEKGLDWLKIHLVNLHGAKKKEPLQGRLDYANSVIDDIIDSADKPLEGHRWWQTGDEPWQVLACCVEITDAIRSGDPPSYVTHVPVQQDGSCNGLQHYAALGRDYLGGKQVNLTPQDKPDDPYAGVAAAVNERRKVDAANGHEIAILLEGKIHRKVVKQTVMTVVYGVTWVGGRLQIEKQLRGNVPDDQLWNCSSYIVENVFAALREMFSNARQIQDWLASSGRKVALAGRPMEWLTPLGLPVVQPYHKSSFSNVKGDLQHLFDVNYTDFSRPPDTRKQKNAMPPNYVHSLDSTHMMLTALHCQRGGVPFVSVHDCFWTLAPFVNDMNKYCREQFVALHSDPILEDLADYWEAKFGGLQYKDYKLKGMQTCQFRDPFPSIGALDLNQVLESTYFFS